MFQPTFEFSQGLQTPAHARTALSSMTSSAIAVVVLGGGALRTAVEFVVQLSVILGMNATSYGKL